MMPYEPETRLNAENRGDVEDSWLPGTNLEDRDE